MAISSIFNFFKATSLVGGRPNSTQELMASGPAGLVLETVEQLCSQDSSDGTCWSNELLEGNNGNCSGNYLGSLQNTWGGFCAEPVLGSSQSNLATAIPARRRNGNSLQTAKACPATQIPNVGPNPGKAQIGQVIEAAARKYGVPVDIAKAVAYQESKWDAKASSCDQGHGKGVMQIDDRFHALARTNQVWDAKTNIEYGVKLLASNFKRYGNWHDAVKHYNGSNARAEKYANTVEQFSRQKPWQKWES